MNILTVKGYKENTKASFVADNITCIAPYNQEPEKTSIWVIGSDEDFVSNEDYESILLKLKDL